MLSQPAGTAPWQAHRCGVRMLQSRKLSVTSLSSAVTL